MGCPGRRWEIVDADPSGALRDRRGKASTGGLSRVRNRPDRLPWSLRVGITVPLAHLSLHPPPPPLRSWAQGAWAAGRGREGEGEQGAGSTRPQPCRLEQVSRKHGLSGNHGFGEDFKWPRTEPHAIHEGRRAQRGWLSIGLLTEGPASPSGHYVGHGGGRPSPRDLMKPRIKPSISIIIGISVTTKET